MARQKPSSATANGSIAHKVKANERITVPPSRVTKTKDLPPAPARSEGMVDEKELLRVLTEVRNGNFGERMPIDQVGLSGKICDTLNEIISLNEKMMAEFTRAGNTIGKQGNLT